MEKLILNRWGSAHIIQFETANYVNNGNLAVHMLEVNGDYYEPWSFLTVNLTRKCAPNCAYIDVNNNGDDIIDWLIDNNLGKPTGRMEISGFCFYPEFEFNMDILNKYSIKEM